MTTSVRFEPLSPADLGWAWDVYTLTTRDHLLATLHPTEDEERDLRSELLRRGRAQAVLDEQGERVGLLEVTEDGDELTIRHLELLPSVQGKGLGTQVIRTVIDRAASEGRSVVLRVLRTNPRARALYERLGFVVEQERERSTQLRLLPRTTTETDAGRGDPTP
ncbi:GNAT family N-acetyltransferase [Nocardioides sp. DS6]|uniref:GNAT family N-acetyltransferase n=1 Tax=Nocardioides eburneus TaxID=3231482 RepID=A0ABV3T205_9ACTN